jgi:TetR/AcrR family transcriptional repressor of nem operon
MKISKEKAAENRTALVRAASRLFREKGIDGVGVAEISKEAGLTHGALYAHFSSKDELAAAALEFSLGRARSLLQGGDDVSSKPISLDAIFDYYLSERQRDNLGSGCAMAAAASEIARQDATVSARYTDGFTHMVGQIEARLDGDNRHQRALGMMAALIGGVAVARSTVKADQELSDEVLRAVRVMMDSMARAK